MSRAQKQTSDEPRIIFVKNLSYECTPEELFGLFSQYGSIRQVRQGVASNSKGTAYVVYDDVEDAENACTRLNGYYFKERYLVALHHQLDKVAEDKDDLEARRAKLDELQRQQEREAEEE